MKKVNQSHSSDSGAPTTPLTYNSEQQKLANMKEFYSQMRDVFEIEEKKHMLVRLMSMALGNTYIGDLYEKNGMHCYEIYDFLCKIEKAQAKDQEVQFRQQHKM